MLQNNPILFLIIFCRYITTATASRHIMFGGFTFRMVRHRIHNCGRCCIAHSRCDPFFFRKSIGKTMFFWVASVAAHILVVAQPRSFAQRAVLRVNNSVDSNSRAVPRRSTEPVWQILLLKLVR